MEGQQKPHILGKFLDRDELKHSRFVRAAIGLFLLVFFSLLFPYAESIEGAYHIGMVWPQPDLVAPFSFPVLRDARDVERDRADAAAAVLPVVVTNPKIEKLVEESVSAELPLLVKAADLRSKWMRTHDAADSLAWRVALALLHFPPDSGSWQVVEQLKTGGAQTSLRTFEEKLNGILPAIYSPGILDSGDLKRSHAEFVVRAARLEETTPSSKFFTLSEARTNAKETLNQTFSDREVAALGFALLSQLLVPDVFYDAVETGTEIRSAIENVPTSTGFVREGEIVVRKDERITEDINHKLDSYRKAKSTQGSDVDRKSQIVGVVMHVALVLAIFGVYLLLFRKRIFYHNGLLGLILLIFSLEGLMAYLTRVGETTLPLQFLILVPAASMLLAIIFDSRVAFYGTISIALLVAGIRGNDYALAVCSIVAGASGAYTVRDIKNRTQIFRSILFVFAGYALAIVAFEFERFEDFSTISPELVIAFANAVLSSVFAYGLLIFFENVFHVTTDLKLLELTDLNSPLLHRLSEEAPGTFHHSITLGNLCEAAADDIGANTVLARVGAYYHDIGKLVTPDYFVENQPGGQNRHSKLKPRMSSRVIMAHVTEGMELAEKAGLPEVVIDFIPQHHGTTLMAFFYDKALKQAAARKNNKEPVREEDYRYPGPKPQTREAGILMLADKIEATTRSMEDVTPQLLEEVVENVIKERLGEGQLDECPLTMRDLSLVKDAFVKILIGIHHQRIQYPELEEQAEVLPPTVPLPVAEVVPQAVEAQAPPVVAEPPAQPEAVPDPAPEHEADRAAVPLSSAADAPQPKPEGGA